MYTQLCLVRLFLSQAHTRKGARGRVHLTHIMNFHLALSRVHALSQTCRDSANSNKAPSHTHTSVSLSRASALSLIPWPSQLQGVPQHTLSTYTHLLCITLARAFSLFSLSFEHVLFRIHNTTIPNSTGAPQHTHTHTTHATLSLSRASAHTLSHVPWPCQ